MCGKSFWGRTSNLQETVPCLTGEGVLCIMWTVGTALTHSICVVHRCPSASHWICVTTHWQPKGFVLLFVCRAHTHVYVCGQLTFATLVHQMCGSRGEHINTTVRERSYEAKEPGDDYCSTRLGKRESNTPGAV